MRPAIVVTGAARGIGGAIAELAVAAGHPIVLVDRDAEAVEAKAQKLGTPAIDLLTFACDVRDEERVDATFRAVEKHLGTIGGVVVAAGIDRGGPLHELDAATWDDVMAVNLRGAFLTCRAAVRSMRATGGGSIVCISSPFARVAAPGVSAYAASKSGICALVRSLAVDYAREGIRVNAVLPGPTDTELMWANVPRERIPEMRTAIAAEVPLGRIADPREPARAALWLLSDDASYVTGAELACDGGVLARASVSV